MCARASGRESACASAFFEEGRPYKGGKPMSNGHRRASVSKLRLKQAGTREPGTAKVDCQVPRPLAEHTSRAIQHPQGFRAFGSSPPPRKNRRSTTLVLLQGMCARMYACGLARERADVWMCGRCRRAFMTASSEADCEHGDLACTLDGLWRSMTHSRAGLHDYIFGEEASLNTRVGLAAQPPALWLFALGLELDIAVLVWFASLSVNTHTLSCN